MTKDVLWRELYKAAILELDAVALHKRIEAAHAAIQQRLSELQGNYDGNSGEEQPEMVDALNNLRAVQKIEFRLSSEPRRSKREPTSEAP
jgi:hypothetical protein